MRTSLSSISTASARGRWKLLRPMIEPLPPPSRMARASSRTLAVALLSEAVGAGLDHPERRGIGGEAGIERELEMIMRVIGRRVGAEAAHRAVREAMVDRQDDQLAGAAEPAMHQDTGEVGLAAGIVA